MVNKKDRHPHDAITETLPVLVLTTDEEPEGLVPLREPGKRTINWLPVKRFTAKGASIEEVTKLKGLQRIANVYTFAQSGKRIDYPLLEEGVRSLLEDAYDQQLADAITSGAERDPIDWAMKWLPITFNNEIRRARPVMWWRPRKPGGPAIYCPDQKTAFFVSLLFGRFRACLGCGDLFIPHRRDQDYHDHLCAHAHRMRRSRRRKGKREN